MNYHSDEWVMNQINRHYLFANELYDSNQIVGVFCQGSTNYGLDCENSDIDTKCIVVPSFKDIALARKPVSTTHILANDEHLDGKDVRKYMETFRKQNLNFLEILFTPYCIINPLYREQWMRLVDERENIAHMNPYRAVKSMKGIAMEKYHAMEHRYPSKVDLIDKYGFDGKQVSHLIRVDDYLERYINGEEYEKCLRPTESKVAEILDYKLQRVPLKVARERAAAVLEHTVKIADDFCKDKTDQEDSAMRDLLEDVQYEIMKIAMLEELK